MAIKKNLSAADIEVLGDAEIRRRRATQGTCASCFTKNKLNDDGVCETCAEDRRPARQGNAVEPLPPMLGRLRAQAAEATSRLPENRRRGDISKIEVVGPAHSPAYLGSCAQSGLPHSSAQGHIIPHPNALGTLPINATPDDYEHYAAARGGHVDDSGVMHVDLRTAEQKDPNHRLYTATPLMVSQKINYNPSRRIVDPTFGTENEGSKRTLQFHTTNIDFHQNAGAARELLEDSAARLSPEQLAEHNEEHDGNRSDITNSNHFDEKGISWLSQPDSCPLCRATEAVKSAVYDHDNNKHVAEVHPLCPKC
jgi:hypothetical protein